MHTLKFKQNLPLTLEECWAFFSNPSNLGLLTPEYLSFKMTCDECEMYAGQIITYTIRPVLNIPLKWVTEITHVDKFHYFIDEQVSGPYQFWHHEHRFIPAQNGVEMIDTVYYKLPLGPIGRGINAIFVQKDIEGIFEYRRKKLIEMFG